MELAADKVPEDRVYTLEDLENLPDPESLVEGGILQEGGKGVTFGPPKSGKTHYEIQKGMSLVSGQPFLGFRVSRRCRVLFVQADMPGLKGFKEWAQQARRRLEDRVGEVLLGDPTPEETRQMHLAVPEDVPAYDASASAFSRDVQANPEACEAFFRMDFEESTTQALDALRQKTEDEIARVEEGLHWSPRKRRSSHRKGGQHPGNRDHPGGCRQCRRSAKGLHAAKPGAGRSGRSV